MVPSIMASCQDPEAKKQPHTVSGVNLLNQAWVWQVTFNTLIYQGGNYIFNIVPARLGQLYIV